MQIHVEKRCWIFAGWSYRERALAIEISFGFREDAAPGELAWRHNWRCSAARLPRLIWRGWRPIGFRAFGRVRIFTD